MSLCIGGRSSVSRGSSRSGNNDAEKGNGIREYGATSLCIGGHSSVSGGSSISGNNDAEIGNGIRGYGATSLRSGGRSSVTLLEGARSCNQLPMLTLL